MSPTDIQRKYLAPLFGDEPTEILPAAPAYAPSLLQDRIAPDSPNKIFTAKGIMTFLFLAVGLGVQLFYFSAVGFHHVADNLYWLLPLNAALGIFVCMMQPILIFSLIIAYFPFINAGIDVEIGIVTLNPYSIGILCLLPLAVIYKLLHQRPVPLHGSDVALLLACVLLMFSTLLGGSVISGGFIAFNAIFLPVLAMFLIRIMVASEAQYGILARVLMLSMLLFSLLAILYFVQTGLRAKPMNTHPISAASCLMLAIFYFALGKYFPRPFRIAAALFCLLGFAVTFSRIFTLVMLLSPLMYLAIKRGRALLLFVCFFAATLAITVALVLTADLWRPPHYAPEEGIYKSSDRLTDEADLRLSLYGRILSYEQGMKIFLAHPLIGIGPAPTFTATGTTEHNFTLEWLEYGGIVGYMLFVAFFLLHVKRIAPLARDDLYLRVNLLVLIAILCNSFFNGIMHGYMPHVAYTAIGLSEARYAFLKRQRDAEAAGA